MATYFSIFAWRIPWTEEPGGLYSIGPQRVGHDWSDLAQEHGWGWREARGPPKQLWLLEIDGTLAHHLVILVRGRAVEWLTAGHYRRLGSWRLTWLCPNLPQEAWANNINPSVPQFLHIKNRANMSPCIIELLWGLNELAHTKYLE